MITYYRGIGALVCGMSRPGMLIPCDYPVYSIPPHWNGSLDGRDDLRVCALHYDIILRAAFEFLGRPWSEETMLSTYTVKGLEAHRYEWNSRHWRAG